VSVSFLAAVTTAAVVILPPSRYESAAVIMPETRSQMRLPAGLGGLAGQFGIALPTEAGQSPQFYASLATSRGLLVDLLQRTFLVETKAPGREAPLLEWLDVSGSSSARQIDNGVRKLRRLVHAGVDTRAGTVTITFEAPDRDLARSVLDTLLGDLNRFNLSTRRSQASEKRRFIESQRVIAQQNLSDAENALQRFYQTNRSWENSPSLKFDEARLRRHLDIAEQLYLNLEREFETARIQEFDVVPVFSVVDPPFVPVRRSFPKRTVVIAFVFVAALLATAGSVVLWEYLKIYAPAEIGTLRDARARLWKRVRPTAI